MAASILSLFLLASAVGAVAADFCAAAAPPFFDARAYGARGNGVTLNTAPLARAVGAAAAASLVAGGARQRVLVSRGAEGGVFLSGQVALLSGVPLCVDAGATLVGVPDAASLR